MLKRTLFCMVLAGSCAIAPPAHHLVRMAVLEAGIEKEILAGPGRRRRQDGDRDRAQHTQAFTMQVSRHGKTPWTSIKPEGEDFGMPELDMQLDPGLAEAADAVAAPAHFLCDVIPLEGFAVLQ